MGSLGESKRGENVSEGGCSTLIIMAITKQYKNAKKEGSCETPLDISDKLRVLEGLVFRLRPCPYLRY
jgi:hypothetical protein